MNKYKTLVKLIEDNNLLDDLKAYLDKVAVNE